MTPELIQHALGWCAVINLGILLFWWLVLMLAHDWVHRFHGKWFQLSRERFDAIHYSCMALFKMGIFIFNIAPYIALRIIQG